ncbi:unnamed protein product [Arctogadus glacialis]
MKMGLESRISVEPLLSLWVQSQPWSASGLLRDPCVMSSRTAAEPAAQPPAEDLGLLVLGRVFQQVIEDSVAGH